MANGNSNIETKRITPSLYNVVDQAALEMQVRFARFTVTLQGNETANQWHTLIGALWTDKIEIVPELSRFRRNTGSLDCIMQLQATLNGVATALTTPVQFANGAALALVAATNAPPPVLTKAHGLRLAFSTVTVNTAGSSFEVELAYRKRP
jgi:hypothetical protein